MYCEGRSKPALRGVLHLVGASLLVPIWMLETLTAVDNQLEMLAFLILSSGAIFCWGSSGLFHVVPWSVSAEIALQKLGKSHSMYTL